jgi:hypothetical protein
VIEASPHHLPGPRAERLLGLAISPHLIAAAAIVGAVGVCLINARELPLWLVLVAAAAGWSSAWSP